MKAKRAPLSIHPLVIMANIAATTPPRKKYLRRQNGLSLTLVLFLCAAALVYFSIRGCL